MPPNCYALCLRLLNFFSHGNNENTAPTKKILCQNDLKHHKGFNITILNMFVVEIFFTSSNGFFCFIVAHWYFHWFFFSLECFKIHLIDLFSWLPSIGQWSQTCTIIWWIKVNGTSTHFLLIVLWSGSLI